MKHISNALKTYLFNELRCVQPFYYISNNSTAYSITYHMLHKSAKTLLRSKRIWNIFQICLIIYIQYILHASIQFISTKVYTIETNMKHISNTFENLCVQWVEMCRTFLEHNISNNSTACSITYHMLHKSAKTLLWSKRIWNIFQIS
jgi:hypothetical protein